MGRGFAAPAADPRPNQIRVAPQKYVSNRIVTISELKISYCFTQLEIISTVHQQQRTFCSLHFNLKACISCEIFVKDSVLQTKYPRGRRSKHETKDHQGASSNFWCLNP